MKAGGGVSPAVSAEQAVRALGKSWGLLQDSEGFKGKPMFMYEITHKISGLKHSVV